VFAREARQIEAAAPSQVVLVDDVQHLDPAEECALRTRLADETAATVIASRPWPAGADAGMLASMDTPGLAIVLGQVGAADVMDQLSGEGRGGCISRACVDDLVALCGGMAWLVAEAIAMHDDDCSSAGSHPSVASALHEVIAQRLERLEPEVRLAVEIESLAPSPGAAATDADSVAAAHAQGLLLRNGRAAPVVRSAVRALTPVERIVSLTDAGLVEPSAELLHGVHDRQIAGTLVDLGDAALRQDPERALELYDYACASGQAGAVLDARRVRALWACGRVDDAADLADRLQLGAGSSPGADEADAAFFANVVASTWAARGMPESADAAYRASSSVSPTVRAGSLIASMAVGRRAADETDGAAASSEARATTMPSVVSVAMGLLERGLRSTLGTAAQDALGDLVRASDAFSMAGEPDPLPELPAVLAGIVALDAGELDLAAGILESAARDGQGGASSRARVLLWNGWVALQRQRPRDVDAAINAAASVTTPLAPRDRLLEHALRVGLARRYSDTAGLTSAWTRAREALLHAEFDLYGIQPLTEFVVTAARLDDLARVQRHFDEALARVQSLGSPIAWSAHLHWTGIQEGILANRPEDLMPHARALVAAAPSSRVAAAMAHAGRVWTSVLGGKVDADAVEAAAGDLATIGLAWDGARLAGYGAGLTDDRRIISRLLACARRLHGNELASQPERDQDARPRSAAPVTTMLSAREREVAALVLRGKTYSEIGAAIFISPRTAEHHIARIRRRLGATSRSDLLTKLRLALEGATEERGDA
jgi:DNA-binding CsgD family transcriptional regulator